MIGDSDCQCKVKGSSPVKRYLTFSKQCHKCSDCSQIVHKICFIVLENVGDVAIAVIIIKLLVLINLILIPVCFTRYCIHLEPEKNPITLPHKSRGGEITDEISNYV